MNVGRSMSEANSMKQLRRTNKQLELQNQDGQGELLKEPPKEYEKLLQKYEADVRGHIRVSLFMHYG